MAWLSDTNILLRMAQPAHAMHEEARLAAAMRVYGVGNLLTFDVHDFARYADIRILQPKDVLKAYSQ